MISCLLDYQLILVDNLQLLLTPLATDDDLIFKFWIELSLALVGVVCLTGAWCVGGSNDDDDNDPSKSDKKKKILRYTLVTLGLLSFLALGVYVYQAQIIPVTGFSAITFNEFMFNWLLHTGSSVEILNYFTSFNPSNLELDQYSQYFRLIPQVMDSFDSLPDRDQWINTNGQGARLASLLDLYAQSHYGIDRPDEVERAQKLSVYIFENLRR